MSASDAVVMGQGRMTETMGGRDVTHPPALSWSYTIVVPCVNMGKDWTEAQKISPPSPAGLRLLVGLVWYGLSRDR